MSYETSLGPMPKRYSDWAYLVQLVSGDEKVDDKGRRSYQEPLVRGVRKPYGLPGVQSTRVNVQMIGNQDRGYLVRARERWLPMRQSTFLVQRAFEPESDEPWMGVYVENSAALPFQPIRQEEEYVTPPQCVEHVTSCYRKLTETEQLAFGELIFEAARRSGRLDPDNQSFLKYPQTS